MLSAKNQSLLIKGGIIVWTLWVFFNYFLHHPSHFYAITEAAYVQTIFSLLVVSGGAYFLYQRKNAQLKGWKIYVFVLLCQLIIFHGFAKAASLYSESAISHLGFFLINNLSLHVGILLIFSLSYIAGQIFIKRFEHFLNAHHQRIIALALGMALFSFLLMFLAAINLLYNWVVIPVAILLLIWRRKYFVDFLKYLFWNPIPNKENTKWTFGIVVLVLFFVSFNLVGAIKDFPIGFDGAVLYQNLTKMLMDTHQLVKGGQAYAWPLFTSMGPLLFGKMSFSILLSHSVGILCIWGMYHLGRLFLKPSATWVSIVIFYTLPALGYHNFVDEKVDLAFLYVSISILIFLIKYGQSVEYHFSTFNKESIQVFVFLGFILGFAMGVKYLTILLLIGIIAMFFYQWGGVKAYLGISLLSLSFLFFVGISNFGYLKIGALEKYGIVAVLGILGLGVFGFFYKKFNWTNLTGLLKNLACLLLVFLISFAPWMLKNAIESKKISSKNLLYGQKPKEPFGFPYKWFKENNIPFKLRKQDKQLMLQHLGQADISPNQDDQILFDQWDEIDTPQLEKEVFKLFKQREKTAKREEILRYLGYETGLPLYLSLPFDLTMNTNIRNKRGVDIGFLFLLILPLFFFNLKAKNLFKTSHLLTMLALLFIFLLSWKATLNNGNQLKDAETHLSQYIVGNNETLKELGQDVYLPLLQLQDSFANIVQPVYNLVAGMSFPFILFTLLLLSMVFTFVAKDNWRKFSQPLKLLMIFTSSYGFLWWILGNGITYYAFVVWLLLSILIIFYLENLKTFVKKDLQGFVNIWSKSLVGLLLVLNLFVHFTNQSNNWKELNNIFTAPFLAHASEAFLMTSGLENSVPQINQAVELLNQDMDAKVYRVGTYLNYHIKDNINRVYEDSQLGGFNILTKMLLNPEDFLTVLKLKGFKYIVFDLNVASIDQTPEKTLTAKANNLVKVLNNQNKVRLLITDKVVTRVDPNTKKQVTGYGLIGKTVRPGKMAIFEIL